MSRRPTGKVRRRESRRQRARHQLGRIREHLQKGNLVVQVRDARDPALTDPGRLVAMPEGRRVVVVLAKADLADPGATRAWEEHLRARGWLARGVSQTRPRQAAAALRQLLERACEDLPGALGIGRAVVVGLPNVGKSTLINRLVGRKAMGAGNRPGVTKGESWARIHERLYLLDTPGVIEAMNRLVNEAGEEAWRLALLRLSPEGIVDPVDAAQAALGPRGPGLQPPGGPLAGETPAERLEELARRWNRKTAEGAPDLHATAGRLLRELGEGKWGRLTLERPPAPPGGEG